MTHPEAKNLLDLFQYPELLETRTVEQIRKIFQSNGYEETDFGQVTIGWGRKVDDPHAATDVIVQTVDGRIVQIGIGSKGSYCLSTIVLSAQKPKPEELTDITNNILVLPVNIGTQAKHWLEEHGIINQIVSEILKNAENAGGLIAQTPDQTIRLATINDILSILKRTHSYKQPIHMSGKLKEICFSIRRSLNNLTALLTDKELDTLLKKICEQIQQS
ncbi:hypothetical protein A3D11_01335 [Candidatus Peribacteria bacterium RIFCSPHIGHO2_02_FULL_49_16]|nr:MAG: hypothetical protein A2880_02460 [Candidatus Peribacteria bacterium RIFCSPHIGHO2_01_FULL_49_38]OGJ59590.1 MAG: hypothetical protein A3D11_01335 [Candidatus Peribacteria bacterium RIFCSPHIGHO2_02_FULL_49_16]